jgi:hypothetical protein
VKTVTISARRLKALESAENCVRAFRTWLGTPNFRVEEREEALDMACDWVVYWLELAPEKTKFELPPDVPARWKYNRDQAMRGWPDKRKEAS